MSELKNCRKCGKMFQSIGKPICGSCNEKYEEGFLAVRRYLQENPRAAIAEVSRELKMSIDRLKTYLKDGRLEITNSEGNMLLDCETCGKSISSGRQCDDCARGRISKLQSASGSLNKTISDGQEEQSKRATGAMRYLNKDKGT